MASPFVLLLSITAATFLFFMPHCRAADRALLDKICRQTRFYDFCMSSLIEDRRTATADIHGLCSISISSSTSQAQATLDTIKRIENGATDPVDKQRINICKVDYEDAINKFDLAFESASDRRDYEDVINKVRDGANKAIDCEDIYRRSDPIRQSPVSNENHRMVDLVEITFIIVDIIRSG